MILKVAYSLTIARTFSSKTGLRVKHRGGCPRNGSLPSIDLQKYDKLSSFLNNAEKYTLKIKRDGIGECIIYNCNF
jgi:hypothetical protein